MHDILSIIKYQVRTGAPRNVGVL